MAGALEIHPAGGTTIVCDTSDAIDTSEYLLISQDLKEADREKIIYSEGKFDGSVINSTASIVTIELVFLINGDTPEEIAVNLTAMKAAFFNIRGGYIEYRPVGYSNSIIPTFYKYLQSAPPMRLREGDVIQSSIETSFAMGQLYRFQIKIFSLATSDPDDIEDIVLSGSCWTYTEGAELGYIVLPESSIKGDGFLPVISVRNASGSTDKDGAVILFSRIETGSEDLDWYTGSPYNRSHVDVTYSASNGFYNSSDMTTWWVTMPIQETSRMLYGRCVPVVSYKFTAAALDIWQIRVVHSVDNAASTVEPLTDWADMPGVTHGLNYWNFMALNSVTLPPIPFPEELPISYISQRIGFQVRVTDGTPRSINVYGLLLSNVSESGWLAKYDTASIYPLDYLTTSQSLAANCPSGMSYRYNGVPPAAIAVTHSWPKQGMSPRDAIMPKGRYQIRAICSKTTDGWGHSEADIIVQGLFYTIYPFSES